MGKAPIPANSDTPATASDWLIALGEQPANEELRARFEAWLAASPDHRRDWAEIARTAEALDQAEPPTATNGASSSAGAGPSAHRLPEGLAVAGGQPSRHWPLRHALPSSLAATSCCASRPTI